MEIITSEESYEIQVEIIEMETLSYGGMPDPKEDTGRAAKEIKGNDKDK